METVDIMAALSRVHASGRPYALVSVLHAQAPASARPGDKAVVDADGFVCGWIGGGCAQPAVLKTVARALDDGQARVIRILPGVAGDERESGQVLEFGAACYSGGVLELFVDPVLPRVQLLVIGSSPVAHALSRLAPLVGFSVFVVAHDGVREGFAGDAVFIDRDDLRPPHTELREGAYVVVATQGRRDLEGLQLALGLRARHIAFVASARKAGMLKQILSEGDADPEAVRAIVAPAGYPIYAVTPEEIALSVLVATVAARRTPAPAASAGPPPKARCCDAEEPGASTSVPRPPTAAHSCCGEEHGLSA